MHKEPDNSDRAAARHLVESGYRLLDAERLASAIRFALQEYNDEAKPIVALIREVTNKLKTFETPNDGGKHDK